MITVTITPQDMEAMRVPLDATIFECYMVGRLRKAGVPVIGLLSFRGVERGTLTRTRDFDSLGIIYEWRE